MIRQLSFAAAGAMSMTAQRVEAERQGDDAWRSSKAYLNARADFRAAGDGVADDTEALQRAIETGAVNQRPILLPPGVYKTTRALSIPPNTMLVGSSPGLGFGCRIEPVGCAAFLIGGSRPCFHSGIENLTIWPKGAAPEFIIAIDNSYSVTIRNIRIHDVQPGIKRAAIVLLGDSAAGGHGRCNDVVWENLIIRNDVAQPALALLAAQGCGTHRFIVPCLENYVDLFEWQGGQIDLIAPYTERAGRYAVHCNTSPSDVTAFLNTYGGLVNSAESGIPCAIRAATGTFNSFGTLWGPDCSRAAYIYSLPQKPVAFHGLEPNLSGNGKAQYAGVSGWLRTVRFPQYSIKQAVPLHLSVQPQQQVTSIVQVRGVRVGDYWARVTINVDARGLHISAYVDAPDSVTLIAHNASSNPVTLDGTGFIECALV